MFLQKDGTSGASGRMAPRPTMATAIGSFMVRSPATLFLKLNEHCALLHLLTGLDADLIHFSAARSPQLHLHLHGLEYHQGLAMLDLVALVDGDIHHQPMHRGEQRAAAFLGRAGLCARAGLIADARDDTPPAEHQHLAGIVILDAQEDLDHTLAVAQELQAVVVQRDHLGVHPLAVNGHLTPGNIDLVFTVIDRDIIESHRSSYPLPVICSFQAILCQSLPWQSSGASFGLRCWWANIAAARARSRSNPGSVVGVTGWKVSR